ncbi:MAG: DUF4388 domain-containing protein [Polyangiaceae bacterium]|jgi:hypothetical protein|nr:DUF4388 domain-containing protein [Polyangiaceae bacterium]
MRETNPDLVRIDDTGTAHAVSRSASQQLRARKGTFRLMPSPPHMIFMRHVRDDGKRDEQQGAVLKLGGEVVTRGALCDIVALISHAGWRGELIVFDGENARSIFFDSGNVVGATSNAEGERLGEILYQFGALSQEQVAQCMALEGKRLGDAAVELGLISREKLFALMSKQTEEITYKTLLIGDGMYYFLDRFDESRLAARTNLRANALLMEAVRRMDEINYFRERIPSDEHIPTKTSKKGEPAEPVRKVFAQIDGELSMTDLARRCEMSIFDLTQAVFQLCQSGHVQIRPPKPTDPIAIVETFNAAMRIILRTVEQTDREKAADLRSTLASFASSSGVYDALFIFAGPEADGSVKTERVVTNIAGLAGDDAIPSLAQWLYEYAAFALFAATSLVSKDVEQTLSRQVSELITPLQQTNTSDDGSPQSHVSIYIE